MMATGRAVRVLTSVVIAGSIAAFAATARAETYEIAPGDDLWARLSALTPGDVVVVHAGTYTQTSRFEATWAGTEAMPIEVRGAEGEARPVLTRDGGQNLLNLHGSYFTLRGLEMTGGSHGIRLSGVDHATFEDLVIHGTGDVGMSCNVSGMDCAYVTIRGCEIYETSGTGEGMYFGCNVGACAFHHGLIERNFVHDTGGSQGDGIEIKSGSWSNVIRDNVIVRSMAPGIMVYTFDPGPDRAPNVIERNVVIDTQADNGIQVTGRAIVRNNIVVGAGASGIASQSNQGTPTEVVIVNNTVLGAADACFRANDWATGSGFLVANNALYCEGGRAMRVTTSTSAIFAANMILGSTEGVSSGFTAGVGVGADLGDETSLGRVYPPAGSALLDAALAAHAPSDDFDLRARGPSPDIGAYERAAGGMAAWVVVEGEKEIEDGVVPVPDGGVPTDDGGPPRDGGAAIDASLEDASASDAGVAPPVDGGTLPSTSEGCSCRASGRSTEGAGTFAMLGTVACAMVTRRRRRA